MNFFTYRKLGLKILVLVAVAMAWVFANSDRPPLAHTGDFGELNCTECHRSFDLGEGRNLGGTFDILGVPDQYTPGQTYTITVRIAQPQQQRWGFELTTRFMEDASQAGAIIPTDRDHTQIDIGGDIVYITHTGDGTFPGMIDGPVLWQFNWTAPNSGTVVFSAAGNAADNDGTAAGDYIYLDRKTTTPASNAEN